MRLNPLLVGSVPAAGLLCLLGLPVLGAGCSGEATVGEEDLGAIEQTIDELARPVWPGVEGERGRFVPLLNGFFGGEPTAFWFAGQVPRHTADLFWFCREDDAGCPFDGSGAIDRGREVGDPVFATMPGEVDHSPFWRMWVVRVPEDYAPNELKSTFGIEEAAREGRVRVETAVVDHGGEIGPAEVIVHCLMVLDGTELEGNGGDMIARPGTPSEFVPLRTGWHKQYRVHVYDFIDTEGVFAPAASSESVPLMTESVLFILHRDCRGGSASPACLALDRDEVPVSEPDLAADLTGDGDRGDTNHILAGLLGHPLGDDPWERPYSPLWRLQAVLVRAESDADVALIDTTGDQRSSDARSVADLRVLFEAGRIDAPEDLAEDPAHSIPSNDGAVFLSCHSQVPAR